MMTEAVGTANMIRHRLQRSRTEEEAAHIAFETLFKFNAANPGPYQRQWERFTGGQRELYRHSSPDSLVQISSGAGRALSRIISAFPVCTSRR